jgi:hypothetical protein
MDILYPHCCGIDVHKKSVMACVNTPDPNGAARSEVRRFGTTTRELLELADWLRAHGVEQVAMESTGVYWKPVWNLLEDEFFSNPRQRATRQERAGTQDRRAGLRLAGEAAAAWPATRQFRTRTSDSRAA